MKIDILTLFPEMFGGVLNSSILRIAQAKGLATFRLHNIRDYSRDKHRCVDDRPYGGGPGMLLRPEPVFDAVEAVEKGYDGDAGTTTKILLTPQGVRYNQSIANELAAKGHLMLICGHYEGFDERIRIGIDLIELSVGDYILSGGELPAMTVVDSVVRLIPGVLGAKDSTANESFENGLLEHPHYTRPYEYRGMRVPDTLVSGHHKEIKEWQHEQSVKRTRERRPDLLRG